MRNLIWISGALVAITLMLFVFPLVLAGAALLMGLVYLLTPRKRTVPPTYVVQAVPVRGPVPAEDIVPVEIITVYKR